MIENPLAEKTEFVAALLKRPQSRKLMLLAGADKIAQNAGRGQSRAVELGGHRPAQAKRSEVRKAGRKPNRQRGPDP
jgi:hypothetical protein